MPMSEYWAERLSAPGQPLVDAVLETTSPGPGELVVRVKAAGICHSDAHYRSGVGSTRYPFAPSQEVADVVAEFVAGVTAHRAADRVCLHYLVNCYECRDCRSGRE